MYYRVTSNKQTKGLELIKAMSFPSMAALIKYLDIFELTEEELESIRILKV